MVQGSGKNKVCNRAAPETMKCAGVLSSLQDWDTLLRSLRELESVVAVSSVTLPEPNFQGSRAWKCSIRNHENATADPAVAAATAG